MLQDQTIKRRTMCLLLFTIIIYKYCSTDDINFEGKCFYGQNNSIT